MILFNIKTYKSSKLNLFSVLLFIVPYFILTFTLIFSANIVYGYAPSFSWDANREPDLSGYRVFYREKGQQYDFGNPVYEGTQTSCTINGLDDNTTYFFVARAFNTDNIESENSVELSNTAAATPGPTAGATDGGGGGGCFVTTVAFGSIVEHYVGVLSTIMIFILVGAIGRLCVRIMKFRRLTADN